MVVNRRIRWEEEGEKRLREEILGKTDKIKVFER